MHWVYKFQGGLDLDRFFENLTVELIHQLKLFTQEEEELYFKGKKQLKDYDLHFLYSVRNFHLAQWFSKWSMGESRWSVRG